MLLKPIQQEFRNLKKERGFTLIELAIVAVFLGILATFAISQFSGAATDSARARSLYDAAAKLSSNWSMATTACGVSTNLALSPLTVTPTAAKNLSMLLGTVPANPAYASCIINSGAKPLAGLTTGPAGAERLFTYPVSAVSTSSRTLEISFANVPESVVLSAYQKYNSDPGAPTAASVPAAADTSDPLMEYSAPSGGTRTITFVMPF